ncbi:MAG: DUF3667 domain-containing protein [Alphaproteobacteria bacterium]|nr:MAG: DUF3667 domain-containing protein [Alphaproteobacteria bacterium]
MEHVFGRWKRQFRRHYTRQQQEDTGGYQALERWKRRQRRRCTNCGSSLNGPFCHICGQKDDNIERPIWTFLMDMLDNILQADSKILRSLYFLLLLPGGLTRSYMGGQRARFTPPLRLYLLVSVAFFLILSMADVLLIDIQVTRHRTDPPPVPEVGAPASTEGADATGTVPEQRQGSEPALAATGETQSEETAGTSDAPQKDDGTPATVEGQPPETPVPVAAGLDGTTSGSVEQPEDEEERKRAEVKAQLRELLSESGLPLPEEARKAMEKQLDGADMGDLQEARTELDAALKKAKEAKKNGASNADAADIVLGDFPYALSLQMFVKNTGEPREGIDPAEVERFLSMDDSEAYTTEVLHGLARAMKNPTAFNDLFNKWLPRALFVLMPLFALILRITHWGKDRYYLNQLVFSLHFHTFLFLLLTALIIVVPLLGGEMGVWIFWVASSVYLIIALKIGEKQSWIRAFLKAGFIWVSYMTFLAGGLVYVVAEGLRELQ